MQVRLVNQQAVSCEIEPTVTQPPIRLLVTGVRVLNRVVLFEKLSQHFWRKGGSFFGIDEARIGCEGRVVGLQRSMCGSWLSAWGCGSLRAQLAARRSGLGLLISACSCSVYKCEWSIESARLGRIR
jgi:hypothetical protein